MSKTLGQIAAEAYAYPDKFPEDYYDHPLRKDWLRRWDNAGDAVKKALLSSLRWQPIETAPKDRPILLYAPAMEGLPELYSVCKWHEQAGFCICELRVATHWMELPRGPE